MPYVFGMKNLFLVFSVLLLSACGGGGGPATSSPASAPLVVAIEGDSLAALANYTTWPATLSGVTVVNNARGSRLSQASLDQYDTAIRPSNPDVFILFTGSNDVAQGVDVDVTWSNIAGLWAKARADGAKVIATTIHSSITHSPSITDDQAAALMAELNRRIRASKGWDVLIDLEAMFPDPTDTTYVVDGIHWTPAGNALVAVKVRAGL